MPTGYISIGSNIDKDIHIPSSLAALKMAFGELSLSSIYKTDAVGFVGDCFYNLVVGFQSQLSAKEIAKILRKIELDHGRTREAQKFSARTLDLDLILLGDQIVNDGHLQIPRDEIERYAFVLEPLAEIAPNEKHPVSGKSYAELWQDFSHKQPTQTKIQPNWL